MTAGERPLDHIGGVKPAAEPDFKQQHVGRMARKQQKRRRGLHLKHRDGRAAVLGFALVEHIDQFSILTKLPPPRVAKTKALVEAHEMRRRVDVHAFAGRFEDGARKRDGRALAVGAGDVNERRQAAFGMIERREQALDSAERQIDAPRMKRQ